MKVKVVASLYLKENDTYILTIQFLDGDKILPGYKLVSDLNPSLFFKVKSLPLSTYNFTHDSFDVIIEKPDSSLKEFEGKSFVVI